jgi:hypothetical protein
MRPILPLLFAVLLGSYGSPALAQDSARPHSVRERVIDALLCRGDSLATIRALAEDGEGLRAAGVSFSNVNEDLAERITFVFDPPLELFGATTTRVTTFFDTPRKEFAAFVFADFDGDQRVPIEKLGLVNGAGTPFPVGEYVTPWPAGETCLPQVGLSRLGRRRFALGCGWCPG